MAAPRSRVLHALARIAMLLTWALVAWGGLLLVSAAVNAVSGGPAPALAGLVPARGSSVWGWLAPFSVVLALAAVLAGVVLVLANRWTEPPQ